MYYNDSSLECSFIQNLLYHKYIPTIRVLQNTDRNKPFNRELYISKNSVYFKQDEITGYRGYYEPFKKQPGITQNLIISSNMYTSDIHEALGNYLRFLRDFYQVDLMPLYNCFSNRYEDDFTLPITINYNDSSPSSRASITAGERKLGTRLVVFPVKFQHTYKLYCKKSTSVKVQLAFYDKKDLITYNGDVDLASGYSKDYPEYVMNSYQIISLNKDQPVVYHTNLMGDAASPHGYYQTLEKYLYLFVEIPENLAEYLVVFEQPDQTIADNIINITSNSSLLINPTEPARPYSDKLLGYLVNYFISPLCEIPENIDKIQRALNGNSLSDIYPPSATRGLLYQNISETNLRVVGYSGPTLISLVIPQTIYRDDQVLTVSEIGNNAFDRQSSLASIGIPTSVTSIGRYAFQFCSSLASINIPDSVTEIGYGSFRACGSLTSVTFGAGVTNISAWAFQSCSNLTSITIPDSVTSIGYRAFMDCRNLTSITFTGTMEQWNTISKGINWNYNTGNYTVHCTDGDISKGA